MSSARLSALLLLAATFITGQQTQTRPGAMSAGTKPRVARRLVILKVDGLNADLLYNTMQKQNPSTGKSRLPWMSHIFEDGGTIFRNFYVRGISLSAPSWSMLDTGQHSIIRGNVEYDRYTGRVYDYLNFVPFYLGYAHSRAVDMPGVEVLDRAGIPLLMDRFPYEERYQGFQLFQRGVRWMTLKNALIRQFSGKSLLGLIENGGLASVDSSLAAQTEHELEEGLRQPEILYLDLFTGAVDHQGHAASEPDAMLHELVKLDALAGRIWTGIEQSALAKQTLFVVVSDHGMNNVPGIVSQTFNLPDLLSSPDGGAHHVITDREQLSQFKLKGMNPLVHRVITPSTASFYLSQQAKKYPTAWLDIDGNERAALYLRNSDLNKLHILLQQLARTDLKAPVRAAAANEFKATLDEHRAEWAEELTELERELAALKSAIAVEGSRLKALPKQIDEDHETGEDKVRRRKRVELDEKRRDLATYESYAAHLRRLLTCEPDNVHAFKEKIDALIPEMALGDNNTVRDLQNYVAGPSTGGLTLDSEGRLNRAASFRHINYFQLLARQRVRNSTQPELGSKPVDFVALRLPLAHEPETSQGIVDAYWLYRDEDRQLIVAVNGTGYLRLQPVTGLLQTAGGEITWKTAAWRADLPLALYEDAELNLPAGQDRGAWLSSWHSEGEWMNAAHRCRYSNGMIGIVEELSSVGPYVPGRADTPQLVVNLERRRRELVQPDLQIFAADHWNFNARFPNPGGNHGSFLRISTHSVWMMAGGGVPAASVQTPYDSLNFASTLLDLLGRPAPLPDRVVHLEGETRY